MSGLTESSAAPGLMLGNGVHIGADVSFGAYVVVHDSTRIGDGCTIEDHVVLGKRPRLAPRSGAHRDVGSLELGAHVTAISTLAISYHSLAIR